MIFWYSCDCLIFRDVFLDLRAFWDCCVVLAYFLAVSDIFSEFLRIHTFSSIFLGCVVFGEALGSQRVSILLGYMLLAKFAGTIR